MLTCTSLGPNASPRNTSIGKPITDPPGTGGSAQGPVKERLNVGLAGIAHLILVDVLESRSR